MNQQLGFTYETFEANILLLTVKKKKKKKKKKFNSKILCIPFVF